MPAQDPQSHSAPNTRADAQKVVASSENLSPTPADAQSTNEKVTIGDDSEACIEAVLPTVSATARTSVLDDGLEQQEPLTRTPTFVNTSKLVVLYSWYNVLLVFLPVALVAKFVVKTNPRFTFASSFLAILPFAKILGLAMDDLPLRLGVMTGTFLRALSGNMVEFIAGIIALQQCQLTVLQASIVGSVLVNTLLCAGTSFLVGGWKFYEQGFSIMATNTKSVLLALSTIALLLPTLLAISFGSASSDVSTENQTRAILHVSRASAVALIISYILFCSFNYRRLVHQLERDQIVTTLYPSRKTRGEDITVRVRPHLDKDGEPIPLLSPLSSCFFTVISIGMIAWLSEYLLSSLAAMASENISISPEWIGLILLPLIGTLARQDVFEAASRGAKDKMTECTELSIGSSLHLTLFIQPILILVAWIWGKNLTLLYDPFESFTLLLTVLLINFAIITSKSNWLMGSVFIITYCLVAITFWYYPGTRVFSSIILAC